MVKGSGRSIEPYHMFEALSKVADLLPKFGGHPMAAGLSIEERNIEEFRRRLNEDADLTERDFIPKIWIDVPMPLEYVSEGLVEELRYLEPFGQGNEKPQFAQKDLTIRRARVLGKNIIKQPTCLVLVEKCRDCGRFNDFTVVDDDHIIHQFL